MDFFLKYIEFVPAYIIDLISLLSSPKAFLKSRNRGDENWPMALRFFGFSAILSFILLQFSNNTSLVLLKGDSILMNFAKLIVFWGAFILFGAAAIKVSWKFVGGKASFDSTLLTHIYSFSMLLLIATILSLIGKGIIQNIFPNFSYADYLKSMNQKGPTKLMFETFAGVTQQQNVAEISGIRVIALLFIGFFTALGYCIWIIATWGAYRDLNNASRARSFVAFIISFVFFLLISGMLLQLVPPTPQVPP